MLRFNNGNVEILRVFNGTKFESVMVGPVNCKSYTTPSSCMTLHKAAVLLLCHVWWSLSAHLCLAWSRCLDIVHLPTHGMAKMSRRCAFTDTSYVYSLE